MIRRSVGPVIHLCIDTELDSRVDSDDQYGGFMYEDIHAGEVCCVQYAASGV